MKICEDCGLKHAHYGLKGSGSKKHKWCGGCYDNTSHGGYPHIRITAHIRHLMSAEEGAGAAAQRER